MWGSEHFLRRNYLVQRQRRTTDQTYYQTGSVTSPQFYGIDKISALNIYHSMLRSKKGIQHLLYYYFQNLYNLFSMYISFYVSMSLFRLAKGEKLQTTFVYISELLLYFFISDFMSYEHILNKNNTFKYKTINGGLQRYEGV